MLHKWIICLALFAACIEVCHVVSCVSDGMTPLPHFSCSKYVISISGPVQTTPEEFENGGFTLKTHQMFSVHTTPDEFQNATIRTSHLGICV